MKKVFMLFSCLTAVTGLTAQNISVSNVTYNKQAVTGTIAEYNFTEQMVSDALSYEIERTAGKGSSSKGFTVYKGVHINEISPDAIDLYVKTERKSKKEKDKSVAYLLISKGYDNFIQPATDAAVFENVRTFLTKITASIAAKDLAGQVEAQEEVVKKEEKKLEDYYDDVKDMEKKIKKLNEDIEEKKKDIEIQKQEVNRQQTLLQALKDKKI